MLRFVGTALSYDLVRTKQILSRSHRGSTGRGRFIVPEIPGNSRTGTKEIQVTSPVSALRAPATWVTTTGGRRWAKNGHLGPLARVLGRSRVDVGEPGRLVGATYPYASARRTR